MSINISKIFLFLIAFIGYVQADQSFRKYSMEFLDVNASSTTPDICEIYFRKDFISRGVYGYTGFIDVKRDIDTDSSFLEMNVYYSSNALTYTLTAFRIQSMTITKAMNNVYKLYLKDSYDQCCTNSPQFDSFVSPMTTRYMLCEKCQLSLTNYPTALRPGFYKYIIRVRDEPNITINFLVKLEWS
ncbi:uncharacterized protein isoform X2 [Musca autumnalis]|uniref:uncharacterized protein isoform X2 n=1 Tax=Musca autumnalis TaxID=221902 RepID=UPI003CE8F29D